MHPHLFTPGPVEVPHSVRAAGAAPLVGHRSEAYFALLEEISALLKKLLRVSQPVIAMPSSGTGALEALAANLLDPGDSVISFSCGAFGDPFREIASRRGPIIPPVHIPRGRTATPSDARPPLVQPPGPAAVLSPPNATPPGPPWEPARLSAGS